METFTDGVFAIAATLLILEITVDTSRTTDLGSALLHLWPSYLAYVTSFITIGIIWMNHHALYTRIAYADRILLVLNLFLLMFVTLIPFPTGLLADHRRDMPRVGLAAKAVAINCRERQPGQHGDAVIALLAIDRGVNVTEPLEPFEGKSIIRTFGLLQAQDVGTNRLEKLRDIVDAQPHRVDVPGRDGEPHLWT